MSTRRPLRQTLGFYTPSFFSIHCESETDSEGVTASDTDFSVLAHEYIHFLQDCSTVFGLLNLANLYNAVREAVRQVYSSTEPTITLPIRAVSEVILKGQAVKNIINPKNQVYELADLRSFTLQVRTEERVVDGFTFPVFNLIDRDSDFSYQIGSRDILESMAYIIERSIFGDINHPPFLPYRTATMVATSILPELNDEMIISAIYEISLNSLDPVLAFFQAIEDLKSNHIPLSFEEVTMFLLNNRQSRWGDQEESILQSESLRRSFKIAKEHLGEILNVPEYGGLLDWITSVLDRAEKMRTENVVFMTQMLMGKDARENLKSLMVREIGTPIVISGTGAAFSFDQPKYTDRLVVFPAILEVVLTLLYEDDSAGCQLISVCNKAVDEGRARYRTNQNCLSAPWKQVNQKNLCPFADIWRTWGLSKRSYSRT